MLKYKLRNQKQAKKGENICNFLVFGALSSFLVRKINFL